MTREMELSTKLTNTAFQLERDKGIVDELRAVTAGGIALPSDQSYEAARQVYNRDCRSGGEHRPFAALPPQTR
jgi:hypothetical protein